MIVIFFQRRWPAELTAGPYPLCPVQFSLDNTYFCFQGN